MLRFVSPLVVLVAAMVFVSAVFIYMHASLMLPILAFFVCFFVLFWWLYQKSYQIAHMEHDAIKSRKYALERAISAVVQLNLWQQWPRVQMEVGAAHNNVFNLQKQALIYQSVIHIALSYAFCALVLTATLLAYQKSASVVVIALFLLFALFEFVMQAMPNFSLGRSLVAKDLLNKIISNSDGVLIQNAPPPVCVKLVAKDVAIAQPGSVFVRNGINFSLDHNTHMLIFGQSGGGKSTLLQTIAGELDKKGGILYFEDADKPYTPKQMAKHIGFLGQTVDIFNQTLRQNLLLGDNNADDERLMQVLALVQLDDFVNGAPLGLDTPLGQYGQALSGGQARRVALARVLLTNKPILLLDEPFAGLDVACRQKLWRTLRAHQKNKMLIVISHHTDLEKGDAVHFVMPKDECCLCQ